MSADEQRAAAVKWALEWVEAEEARLGRQLTDWERHVIADQVYFSSLPDGEIGPPGKIDPPESP